MVDCSNSEVKSYFLKLSSFLLQVNPLSAKPYKFILVKISKNRESQCGLLEGHQASENYHEIPS